MKHAKSILEYFEYFCQMSSKSIIIILSYSVSKLVHFLRHSVYMSYIWMSVDVVCSCSRSLIHRRSCQCEVILQQELSSACSFTMLITYIHQCSHIKVKTLTIPTIPVIYVLPVNNMDASVLCHQLEIPCGEVPPGRSCLCCRSKTTRLILFMITLGNVDRF